MNKKFWLSATGCFFAMLILGVILHVVFLDYIHDKAFGEWGRGKPSDAIAWSLIVAYVIPAVVMAWMYPKGYTGGSPVGEGLRFGIAVGVLIFVTYAFLLYAKMKVDFTPTLLHSFIHVIEATGGGIAIGLIYGKRENAA